MKTKIILSFFVIMITITSSYASFPVTRTVNLENSTSLTISADKETTLTSPASSAAEDKFVVALLLWFFLGGLAGHRWYLGSPVGWNILFILTLGGVGVWWIIDGIDILTKRYPGL
jgi:hypothetical protein